MRPYRKDGVRLYSQSSGVRIPPPEQTKLIIMKYLLLFITSISILLLSSCSTPTDCSQDVMVLDLERRVKELERKVQSIGSIAENANSQAESNRNKLLIHFSNIKDLERIVRELKIKNNKNF